MAFPTCAIILLFAHHHYLRYSTCLLPITIIILSTSTYYPPIFYFFFVLCVPVHSSHTTRLGCFLPPPLLFHHLHGTSPLPVLLCMDSLVLTTMPHCLPPIPVVPYNTCDSPSPLILHPPTYYLPGIWRTNTLPAFPPQCQTLCH